MDLDLEEFIADIRNEFPEASEEADKIHKRMGFELEDKAFYTWVEGFADVTNGLIKVQKKTEVLRHFQFFSSKLNSSSQKIKECIDVGYVEGLLWDLDALQIKWAWVLLPTNLQELYTDMWGKPDI